MNILVVDDEIYCVQGIKEMLDWASIGIENVFTAYSMGQAQKVFEDKTIDILLADIEMPKGSGLDLVEWAYDHNYRPVVLFLTSYAKFEYAQKAIQMKCLGYIIKPADIGKLETELRKAVDTIRKAEEQERNQYLAEYWDSQVMNRIEAFWYELFISTIQPEENNIRAAIQKKQLPMETMQKNYYYILVKADLNVESINWERGLLNYAIRNVLSEVICHNIVSPIPYMGENQFMLVCDTDQFADEEEAMVACNEATRACEKALPGKFTLYLSGRAGISEAAKQYDALRKLENEYITNGSFVISEKAVAGESGFDMPDIPIEAWIEALLTQKAEKVIENIGNYFTKSRMFYPRVFLNELYYSILQVINSSMEQLSIPTKGLFTDKSKLSISEATKSVEGFLRWTGFILDKAVSELKTHKSSGSIVENVRNYIHTHLNDEDLSRSRIASEIHLNPDYLSFIFREKTGESLVSFITSERIQMAKKLLIASEQTIRDVAIQTGFMDISYFSKQFKRQTSMTPQEYRKSVMKNCNNP